MKYASLCLLSYNRPQFLAECIRNIHATAGYPFELILHDDGSVDNGDWGDVNQAIGAQMVSRVIQAPMGHNEGVGHAMRDCFALASGDPIIKVDQDLLFQPDWLAKIAWTLRINQQAHQHVIPQGQRCEPRIGAMGAFKYHHDPVDHAKMNPVDHAYFTAVDDFVGSLIAVPRDVYRWFGPFETHSDAFAEDVAFKTKLRQRAQVLALPPEDLAVNRGFGPGPSTVVHMEDDGSVGVAKIHHGPKIFVPSETAS